MKNKEIVKMASICYDPEYGDKLAETLEEITNTDPPLPKKEKVESGFPDFDDMAMTTKKVREAMKQHAEDIWEEEELPFGRT